MAFEKQTVRDADVSGKTVLVRVDYNVPQDDSGAITDDLRIRESLPTIRCLLEAGARRVVLISHLGRPDGEYDEKYSLLPIGERLAELLPGTEVKFVEGPIDKGASVLFGELPDTKVVLLDNLRFDPGEEADSLEFAEKLVEVSGADIFVQDAFGASHRAHASTDAITRLLSSYAGLLLEREVDTIMGVMESPARPFVAVIGGAKISDKIGVVKTLVEKADKILVGGAMANTFLKNKGMAVGKSRVEDGQEAVLEEIYELVTNKVGADAVDDFIMLPIDVVVADEISEDADVLEKDAGMVLDDDIILDIGPKTQEKFKEVISGAKTVIWNGTMGLTEIDRFSRGSEAVLNAISENDGLVSVIGGGDTAGFVQNYAKGHDGVRVTHISTGGGASLELIEGKKLPGVEGLLDR